MMMGGGWLIGLLVLFLFLLLLVGLVVAGVWLMRPGSGFNLGGPPRPAARDDEDAVEILRRRYAQGEITREQYETMREDLRR